MPLDKLNAFTKKVQDLADKPNSTMSAAEVKAQFDAAPDKVRVYLNQLIDDLQSTLDTDSGADNIGATGIAGLTGTTVQTLLEALKALVDTKSNSLDVFTKTVLQSAIDGASGADEIGVTPIATSPNRLQGMLEWLKLQIDSTVLGQIPDGSITDVKLSNDPNNIKQVFTLHEAPDAIGAHNATNISVMNPNFTGIDLDTVLDELFTSANNLKSDWAGVVGSPLISSDTSAQLKSKTQTIKNDLATNLSAKGQSSLGTETLDALVDKVTSISTSKQKADGSFAKTFISADETFVISNNLSFAPRHIIVKFISNGKTVYSVYDLDSTVTIISINETNTKIINNAAWSSILAVTGSGFSLNVKGFSGLSTTIYWYAESA